MTEQTNRSPARDPQDLERLLIDRQHAGDIEGMVVLFEPQAVVDCGEGKFLHGHPEIRRYFTEVVASGRKFARGAAAGADPRRPRAHLDSPPGRRRHRGSRAPARRRHLAVGHRPLHHRDRAAIVARQVAGDCRATPAIRRWTDAASQQPARNCRARRASELTHRDFFG